MGSIQWVFNECATSIQRVLFNAYSMGIQWVFNEYPMSSIQWVIDSGYSTGIQWGIQWASNAYSARIQWVFSEWYSQCVFNEYSMGMQWLVCN